ncbi:MAG TPA: DUF6166 domain-containing protein [Solirubrobacteraceae bacterium]|nr:DUF6166 domain-containing protein [Solirubrobacteraceae bacterium]
MDATNDLRMGFPAGDAPGTRGPRDLRRQERYYVGRRSGGAEVYVVSRVGIEPLEHHGYRGSAPFDWGATSPGALELAFAMLAHGTESRPPDLICSTFWSEVVACLDRAGFVLCHGDLALWLLTAFRESEQLPLRRRLSLRSCVRRTRSWRRRR